MTKIAINGLGRIGRASLKIILETPELELIAINDIAPVETLAYLLTYDGTIQDDSRIEAALPTIRHAIGENASVILLAKLADLFVNDAFATAHRAHASTEGVAHHLPSVAGLLMVRETRALQAVRDEPEHPFVAVFGGAKFPGKILTIEHLNGKELPAIAALQDREPSLESSNAS